MAVTSASKVNKLLASLDSRNTETEQKASQFYAKNTYNPFLDKNGDLKNRNIDYQSMLNSSRVPEKVKSFISSATGLEPAQNANTSIQPMNNRTVMPVQNQAETGSNFGSTAVGNSASNIVNAATKYIGTPYVWGGESPEEGGMDCSGFVYNALKDAGYKIGRTTAQGYRGYGNTVSKSEMQPGDLVFYGNGNKASHIGIYIGNGQIIQSSGDKNNTKSNPGKGVSIKNVDYRNDFLEARRY